MIKLKRQIAFILAFSIFFSAFLDISTTKVYAASPIFSLKQAVYMAQVNYPDTRLKRIELSEKRIALTEAIEEIASTRKEQRTIKFSLIFNLEFPEKTTLNKEQELISMVPSIESEIRILKKAIIDLEVEAEYKAVTQYSKAYCTEQQLILEQQKYDTLKDDVNKTSRRVKTGVADKDDLKQLNIAFEKQTSVLSSQRSQVMFERDALSSLVCMKTDGYSLENPLSDGMMPRDKLEEATKFMLDHDVNIFSAKTGVEYTSYCVQLLDDLYTQRWGYLMNDIRPYLYKDNVPPDVLLDKYEDLLKKIDKPWDGVYKIWLLFIPIRLPKLWFKGSRDGQRYFSDGKYPLLTAVYDRDSAKEEYKQLIVEKRKMVSESYENMRQANKAYTEACIEKGLTKEDYQKMVRLNKIGSASQGEVVTARDGYMEAQKIELETLQNYNALLTLFNRQTCGFLSGQVKKEISFDSVGAGDSFKQATDKSVGTYHKKDVITNVLTSFSIELAEDCDATDYELLCGEQRKIGERSAVSKEIVHISSAFKSDEQLILHLYKNGKIIGKANINPNLTTGELLIKSQTKPETSVTGEKKKEKLGTFKVSKQETDIISEIKIMPSNMKDVKTFNLSDKNGVMLLQSTPIDITQPFVYASVGLIDTQELILYLYDSKGQLITKADMNSANGEFYKREE